MKASCNLNIAEKEGEEIYTWQSLLAEFNWDAASTVP